MNQIQTTPPVLQIPASAPTDIHGVALFFSVLVQALNNWAQQLISYLYPVAPVLTVATLPTSPNKGTILAVSDGAAALAWGATVTGGGSTFYTVQWNGSAWTVLGK